MMSHRQRMIYFVIVYALGVVQPCCGQDAAGALPKLTETSVTSSLDGSKESVLYWAPESARRVYLAGTSGGGHMSMLMAGHHPNRFSAVSAWVGISDLAEWYRFHVKDGKPQRYAQMILSSLGGAPGVDAARDADYRDRSPLFHLHRVGDLPIELLSGIRDGHTGSVPPSHTLRAFNVIAKAHGTEQITDDEIESLATRGGTMPALSTEKAAAKREVFLHRSSGNARVTIFDGGHEGLPGPACDWLAKQQRDTLRATE